MPISSDAFTYDELYDPEITNEAYQIGLNLEEAIDSVPRFETAALIALAAKFIDICDGMDVDPEAAFAQIADGVNADAFEPEIKDFIHAASNTTH